MKISLIMKLLNLYCIEQNVRKNLIFGIANLLHIYEGNGEDLKILKKMTIHLQ